jgi:hypothetical protein
MMTRRGPPLDPYAKVACMIDGKAIAVVAAYCYQVGQPIP